jgi:hypothetical protein
MSLIFWKPTPFTPLPWSSNLPVEFQKRRGYALEPWIPALIADAGPRGIKARYDFWQTVAEVVSENYFGALKTWCAAHNIASGGHLLLEEDLTQHVALYGDFFRCQRQLDIPGIDALSGLAKDSPWYTARLVRSAADLDRKPLAMCETCDLRDPKEQDLDEIRGVYNRLMLGGIDAHNTYYPLTKFNPGQVRAFNEWVGRCTTQLTGGRPTAEIAVLYPIESLWARYTPVHGWGEKPPAAQPVQDTYLKALDTLYQAQRDFVCIDTRTLTEATVQDGALVHDDLKWHVLILPMVDTLPPAAWESLRRYMDGGGVVISLGALPANTDAAFPSPDVQAAARARFGAGDGARVMVTAPGQTAVYLPQDKIDLLPVALDGLLGRDLTVSGPPSPIRMVHRRAEDREVYFLINDGPAPWTGQVSFAASGEGEQWDPATGQRTGLDSNQNVTFKMGPYDARLIRFKDASPAERLTPDPARLPGIELVHPAQ